MNAEQIQAEVAKQVAAAMAPKKHTVAVPADLPKPGMTDKLVIRGIEGMKNRNDVLFGLQVKVDEVDAWIGNQQKHPLKSETRFKLEAFIMGRYGICQTTGNYTLSKTGNVVATTGFGAPAAAKVEDTGGAKKAHGAVVMVPGKTGAEQAKAADLALRQANVDAVKDAHKPKKLSMFGQS